MLSSEIELSLIKGNESNNNLIGAFENDILEGLEDYALITDFNPTEDTIELSGSKTNYRLDASPIETITGTAIYRIENQGKADELIGIIQGITDLDITSDIFKTIVSSINNIPTFNITNLVASNNDSGTISLSFNNPEFINKLQLELAYNSDLLNIQAIAMAKNLPSDWQLISSEIDAEKGTIKATIQGTETLTNKNLNLINFDVNVPDNAIYGSIQKIKLESVKINNRSVDIQSNNGIQMVAKLGDISKDGNVNTSDVHQIMRLAVGLDSPNADNSTIIESSLIADINQDGVISAFDAYLTV